MIFAAIVFLIMIYIVLRAVYLKVYIKRYYYECGDQLITIKKGVFAPREIHVLYQKIQDVYVDQDILDRMMGLYDVHIASATVTSGVEAHIDGVDKTVAEGLKNFILARLQSNPNPVLANSANYGAPAPATAQPEVSAFQFSQKISTATYPISDKWMFTAIFQAAVSSLILTIIAFFWVLENFSLSVKIVGALVLFIILFIGRIIWLSIWKKNYYFEFMPEYIILRTGVFSRQENHLPYKSIQNIMTNQGVFERFLGLGTVQIQNAAQFSMPTKRGAMPVSNGINIVGQPYAKAEELNQVLNQVVAAQKNSGSMGL